MTPTDFDNHIFGRLIGDLPVDAASLSGVSPALAPLAARLASSAPADRPGILDGFSLSLPKPGDFLEAIAFAERDGPAPAADPPRRFATSADIRRMRSAVSWVWEGFLPSARIVGIAAPEGTGKSRFALDLARRVWHGEPWPDGQPMTIPARSPSLWIAADGQHDEIDETLEAFGMPAEAVVYPADPDEPYDGTCLDDAETIAALDGACRAHRPAFVIIDSLTYATRSDISEQRTIATLKTHLVGLAQSHKVVVMLLLHVSKEGQALGRRVKGITRTLLHLEAPDPARSDRLRLWVEKSYAAKPPPLGVTIGPAGNAYDFDPPPQRDPSKGGRPPAALGKATGFLLERLAAGDRKACELVSEWEADGGAKATLFNAKKSLEGDGRLVVDSSVKPQVWHIVASNH